ncbi:hypothetical protein MRS44_005271 [Fusarium solani]|uniref:uncharacterized protein n=1 Tax=Fusarium solani TaxID=169388 RepID=UPI0032C4388A|nr:hypothetical protein MRS44_005271 [Fusarium solani]
MSTSKDIATGWDILSTLPPVGMFPIWLSAILALVIFAALFSLLRAGLSPLRAIPGPFLSRFTDLWYLSRLYRGQFEQENLELHERYGNDSKSPLPRAESSNNISGPIVRLGPNRYSFSHPDALKAIYGPSAAHLFPKSPSYRPAAPPDREKMDPLRR